MLLDFLALLGICVQAVTGAIAAGRKNMDFFGVLLIGAVAALGGGTIRDVFFNLYPLVWVEHPEYLLYTSVSAVLTIAIAHSLSRVMKLFLILDAAGLAAFVILGTEKGLYHGLSPVIAVISGLVTGVCGGMIRDILCNDIPLILRRELYAVIALGGAVIFVVLHSLHVPEPLNVSITLLLIFITRILAVFFHIEMPKFNYQG